MHDAHTQYKCAVGYHRTAVWFAGVNEMGS